MMDRFDIGKRIMELRKERGITQEKLATMVGVSAGAVSKWETGNASPDIFLLSPLARALDTSIDVLLCHQDNLNEEELGSIKKELMETFLHKGYENGEKKCRVYMKEYPNCYGLKYIAAGYLQMYIMLAENQTEDFISHKMDECAVLFKEAAEGSDIKYKAAAWFSLASLEMSRENYDESEKALNEMPDISVSKSTLIPELKIRQCKLNEAETACKGQLMHYLFQTTLMLTSLFKIARKRKDYTKALFYIESAWKLEKEYHVGLCSAACNCSKLYMDMGKFDEASKWFGEYVESLLGYGYDNSNNPYFNGVELEVKPDGQAIIRKKLYASIIEEEDFKPLSGYTDYEKAIEALREQLMTNEK